MAASLSATVKEGWEESQTDEFVMVGGSKKSTRSSQATKRVITQNDDNFKKKAKATSREPNTQARRTCRVDIRRNVELRRYGYTLGCAGCKAVLTNVLTNCSRGEKHSEACRARIETAMREDDHAIRFRILAADQRLKVQSV